MVFVSVLLTDVVGMIVGSEVGGSDDEGCTLVGGTDSVTLVGADTIGVDDGSTVVGGTDVAGTDDAGTDVVGGSDVTFVVGGTTLTTVL